MSQQLSDQSQLSPVVIVGAGIIGLLVAWQLSRAGRRSVILDRQSVGRESSWAGAGILSPLDPDNYPKPVLELAQKSDELYDKIAKDVSNVVDPELFTCGLKINRASKETYFPNVKQVRNPRLVRGLAGVLYTRGLSAIKENTAASSFIVNRGRLTAVNTSKGELRTSQCVVTAGAWSGMLLRCTGLDLPIRPIRGQMLLFRAVPGLLESVTVVGDKYLLARRDGRILMGSTVEDVGFDKSTTATAYEELSSAAYEILPALRDFRIERHWAGLRPGSPHGIPYIGEHPTVSGLYVCTGHHRAGFATAPASARLIVDLLLGATPSVDPRPYALDRIDH